MKHLTIPELVAVQYDFDIVNFHANEPRLRHVGRHLGKVVGRYSGLAEQRFGHRPEVTNPALMMDDVIPNLVYIGLQYMAVDDQYRDIAAYDDIAPTLAAGVEAERVRLARGDVEGADSDELLRIETGKLTEQVAAGESYGRSREITRSGLVLVRLAGRIAAEEQIETPLQELYVNKPRSIANNNGTVEETEKVLERVA